MKATKRKARRKLPKKTGERIDELLRKHLDNDIKRTRDQIRELQTTLERQLMAKVYASEGDYAVEIKDYSGEEWYVGIDLPYQSDTLILLSGQLVALFIEKEKGEK